MEQCYELTIQMLLLYYYMKNKTSKIPPLWLGRCSLESLEKEDCWIGIFGINRKLRGTFCSFGSDQVFGNICESLYTQHRL